MSEWESASNWNDDGWESATDESQSGNAFLKKATQVGKNALGGLDAVASMAAGLPAQIYSGYQGLGTLLTTGDVTQAGQAVRDSQEKNFGFGAPQAISEEGRQVSDMLSHGMESVKNSAGDVAAKYGGELGRTNAEIATEAIMNFLPLPGAKGVSKLAGHIENNLKRAEKASLKEAPKLPQEGVHEWESAVQQDLPLENSAQQIAEMQARDAGQRDLFGPRNEMLEQRVGEVSPDVQTPLGKQQSLDLSRTTPPEEIAAKLAAKDPQMDMFVQGVDEPARMQQAMQQEALQKQALEQQPVSQADFAIREQQMEQAYQQREAAKAAEAQQAKLDAHNDMLDKLEQELNVRRPRDRIAVPRGQRGALNIEAVADGFRALKDGVPVGKLISNLTPEQGKMLGEHANVDIVKVDPSVKGTGVGKALYDAWNKAHEGRIAPSGKTSPDAWKVWKRNFPEQLDAFVTQEANRIRSGADPQMVVGNITDPAVAQRVLTESKGPMRIPAAQRGALNFGGIAQELSRLFSHAPERLPKTIGDIVGNSTIPKDPLPADILSKALAEGKDTNSWSGTRNLESGGSLAAASRNSELVRGVSQIVQNASKRADLMTKTVVEPVRKQIDSMPAKDVINLAKVFKHEMLNKKLLTAEELQASGISEKMMQTYADMRKMFEHTLQIQNEARLSMGLDPIKGKEYYTASRWEGDFRQPVHDKEGKIVWYLAAHSKWGLQKQAKALLKDHPGLVIDQKLAHKTTSGLGKNDLQATYTTMRDVLGRDDPAVQKMATWYESAMEAEGRNTMGQEKHFENKANVRGFVGDRPGKDLAKESLGMFQEQLQYAKNAYQWASAQEAGAKLKEVFSDEKLAEQQPKNVEYAKDYWKNSLGQGTAKWVSAIEDAFRETGVSPQVLKQAIGTTKSFFIQQKLSASVGFIAANLLQPINAIPHLIDTMVKGGGNPVKAIGAGLTYGPMMALGHAIGKEMPGGKFFREAQKYAEDNGVISKSGMDEAPIDVRGPVTKLLQQTGKTISAPEVFVRSTTFTTFAEMLRSSGKYADNLKLFQRAEELTNMSMVDYRRTEKPMLFNKLGVVGDMANTLQTYPINFYNQYRYFGKEAMRGNVAPLMAMLAVQGAMAGVAGIPGFNDLDQLLNWGKDKLPDTAWAKVKDFDPKLWMIDKLGTTAVYGALSTKSDINMSGRVSAPGLSDMVAAPGGPVADIAKQAGDVASMVSDPTNATKRAQTLRNVAPSGLQGYLETGPLKDQFSNTRPDGSVVYKKASKLEEREGQYSRTPFEEKLRSVGLRSQKEALTNDVTYRIGEMDKDVKRRSTNMVDKYYDAVRRGDLDRAGKIQGLYTELNGRSISDKTIETNIQNEFMSSIERQGMSAKERLEAVKGLARIQKVLDDNK